MTKNFFRKNLNQIFPIGIMGLAYLFFVTSAFHYDHLPWFPWLITSRIALGVLSVLLITWLSVWKIRWKHIDSIFLTLCLMVQASHGILEAADSTEFYNYTGVLFIVSALSYKGTFRVWLTRYAPFQVSCLLVPIFLKQSVLHYTLPALVDKFSFTLAALFIGTALTRMSATKHDVLLHNLSLQATLLEQHKKSEKRHKHFANLAIQLAHDIRSPLSSMKAALELLREQCGSLQGIQDGLNLLQLSSQRLEGIASGLLAKYKGMSPAQQLFSIHEILDELSGEFQVSPLGKGVEFKKDYDASALYVSGNKTDINRAIGNIMKNALEAMEHHGTLSIRTSTEEKDALIAIADTGPGMTPELLGKILSGGHTEGKRDGHGIGMKVVREVVEELGGKLRATSEVGRGTTFFIKFPLAKIQEKSAATVAIHVVRSKSVLIIDDDPSLREQWRLLLQARNVQTILCASWEDFERQGVSLEIASTAIVDYHFDNSEVNGVLILKRLRDRGFLSLTLCTSEYWKPSIQTLAADLGIVLCPKPLPHIEVVSDPAESSVTKMPRVLVIDDDEGIRLAWKLKKKSLAIAELQIFSSMEDCDVSALNYASFDLAYIDKNIEGSKWSLEQTIIHLKERGVKKVIIASGVPQEELLHHPACMKADGISAEKIPTFLQI